MQRPDSSPHPVSRRQFLRAGLLGGCGLALSACQPAILPTPMPHAGPPATPTPHAGPPITPTPNATPTLRPGPRAIVGDVLDFVLSGDQWPGGFGSVTFRLHEALHDGQPAYHIRTDASNQDFARENQLVWVPLLLGANEAPIANLLYTFDDGRTPVIRSIPGQPDFSSLFELVAVTVADDALLLTSADEVTQAADAGAVALEPSGIFVNCPVVKWPGGELFVDDDLTSYLGTGQLLAPVDTGGMTVTFKLHEGYPGDRYITIDTSAVDRAPDLHIAAAAASWALVEHNATDEVFVFANGIPGPGVFGFQPAVFGSEVDSLVWSPFWNHFTVQWFHEENARILHNADEVYDAIERGELEKFNGVPDSHPAGFVVNCPIPVLADNTFAS